MKARRGAGRQHRPDDEGAPEVAQEEEQYQQDEGAPLEQGIADRRHRAIDQVGLIIEGDEADTGGHRGVNHLHRARTPSITDDVFS